MSNKVEEINYLEMVTSDGHKLIEVPVNVKNYKEIVIAAMNSDCNRVSKSDFSSWCSAGKELNKIFNGDKLFDVYLNIARYNLGDIGSGYKRYLELVNAYAKKSVEEKNENACWSCLYILRNKTSLIRNNLDVYAEIAKSVLSISPRAIEYVPCEVCGEDKYFEIAESAIKANPKYIKHVASQKINGEVLYKSNKFAALASIAVETDAELNNLSRDEYDRPEFILRYDNEYNIPKESKGIEKIYLTAVKSYVVRNFKFIKWDMLFPCFDFQSDECKKLLNILVKYVPTMILELSKYRDKCDFEKLVKVAAYSKDPACFSNYMILELLDDVPSSVYDDKELMASIYENVKKDIKLISSKINNLDEMIKNLHNDKLREMMLSALNEDLDSVEVDEYCTSPSGRMLYQLLSTNRYLTSIGREIIRLDGFSYGRLFGKLGCLDNYISTTDYGRGNGFSVVSAAEDDVVSTLYFYLQGIKINEKEVDAQKLEEFAIYLMKQGLVVDYSEMDMPRLIEIGKESTNLSKYIDYSLTILNDKNITDNIWDSKGNSSYKSRSLGL